MKINWLVRIKNKTFWITIIPALILLVQAVLSIFGVDVKLEGIEDNLFTIVNAVFTVLAIMGIVTDPTTDGVSDSAQAMTYETPRKSFENGDI